MDVEDRSAGLTEQATPDSLPGHFVSDEHRVDCARFLDDVRSMVDRRREADRDRPRLGPAR
jgi:hypothetical protein